MDYTPVSAEVFAQLEGLDDWRYASNAIHTEFDAGSFPAAGTLASAVADAAEAANHHPDLELRYPGRLVVHLTSHSVGEATQADVDLARTISELAAAVGATADPHAGQTGETAIDSDDGDNDEAGRDRAQP